MADEMSAPEDFVRRKQSRPARARGRAGYRRFEAVLEAANIVVQRVETENDIGRDAFVDIVEGTDVTGGVICAQVKSGPSFFYNGEWVVPGKPSDFTLWRESTVPVFGVVHEPATDALRWVDLSNAASLAHDRYLSPTVAGPFGLDAVPVPQGNRLDQDVAPFLAAAGDAIRRRTGLPVAALLSGDDDTVDGAIADTFALGRHDPAAFLLLAVLFNRLPKACRRFAVVTLAMTTSHPDVFWTKENWVPDKVSAAVRRRVRWTEADTLAFLCEIDENGIDRGTIGQTVHFVLRLDSDLMPILRRVALNRAAPDAARLYASVLLLYEAGEDAPKVLDRLLSADDMNSPHAALFPVSKSLEELDGFEYLLESVAEQGVVFLY